MHRGDINPGPARWWPFPDCCKDLVRFPAANKLFKLKFLNIDVQTCNHQPALSSPRPAPLPRNQSYHSHRWCGLPAWAPASPWSLGHFLAPRTTPGTQHPRQPSAPFIKIFVYFHPSALQVCQFLIFLSFLYTKRQRLKSITCTIECHRRWPRTSCQVPVLCDTLPCSDGRSSGQLGSPGTFGIVAPWTWCSQCGAHELQQKWVACREPYLRRWGKLG